jgi:hypothetical protein
MESIRNSFDKLSRSRRENIYNKPSQSKLSQFETMANRPINNFTYKNNTPIQKSVASKSTKLAFETYNNTLSFFGAKNYIIIFSIIMLLALFGINIFTYLSQGINYIIGLINPIFLTGGNVIGDATKNFIMTTSTGTQQIIETGSETTKNIVDVSAKGTTSGINFLQGSLKKNVSAVKPENNNPSTDYANKPQAEPDPSTSASSSHGFCYIGNINSNRHCAKVDKKDMCMSGDIYPTMDICINPNIKN